MGEAETETGFWTFDGVLERLVETVRAWRRMPGGGSWPFASDGPWHLVRKEWQDWDARDPKPIRPLPLLRAEIAAMNEATEWLTWVEEGPRRALVAGLVKLANGHKRVPWGTLRRQLGVTRAGRLEWQFDQSVKLIANVLNALAGLPYISERGAGARWAAPVVAVVARVRAQGRIG